VIASALHGVHGMDCATGAANVDHTKKRGAFRPTTTATFVDRLGAPPAVPEDIALA